MVNRLKGSLAVVISDVDKVESIAEQTKEATSLRLAS